MTCCHRCATEKMFDATVARRELRRFRKKGAERHTAVLIEAVQARRLPAGATLLDIGGGVGAIHHALLDAGYESATHVDASSAYVAAAREEAERRGHADRVEFYLGTFGEVASDVAAADVVTLDRVVCCDPDYRTMLQSAADHARRLVGFSYPRPRWFMRAFSVIHNQLRRWFRSDFLFYLHPPAGMAAVLEGSGFRRAWSGGTFIWAVEVFERA